MAAKKKPAPKKLGVKGTFGAFTDDGTNSPKSAYGKNAAKARKRQPKTIVGKDGKRHPVK
jgi:hypothetical protein